MKLLIHILVWFFRYKKGSIDKEVRELLDKMSINGVLVKHFIKKDSIILDVGAHAGSWAVPLSEMVPSGHVYAFEALPYYSKVLKSLLKLLGRKNISVHNLAVNDKNETISVTYATNDILLTGNTHITNTNDKNFKEVKVQGVTLDKFIYKDQNLTNNKVAFIKIDIEGAESLAIKGAGDLIKNHRPILLIEVVDEFCFHFGSSSSSLINYLKEMGYTVFLLKTSGDLVQLSSKDIDKYTGDKKSDLGTDILFFPTELIPD